MTPTQSAMLMRYLRAQLRWPCPHCVAWGFGRCLWLCFAILMIPPWGLSVLCVLQHLGVLASYMPHPGADMERIIAAWDALFPIEIHVGMLVSMQPHWWLAEWRMYDAASDGHWCAAAQQEGVCCDDSRS